MDALMRASDVDRTPVRAVALTDKPATGPLSAAGRGTDKPARSVNRDDLAAFLIDTVEQNLWVQRTPLVWNARPYCARKSIAFRQRDRREGRSTARVARAEKTPAPLMTAHATLPGLPDCAAATA
jgi:hypothetical protein